MRRDAAAIAHHYDVGNDFYRLVLGPSMTYSCARFAEGETDLAAAQAAKHDLICRKLGLAERPAARLLDVGCGWGSMAIHAASHYDVSVVGITISEAQALPPERVAEAGLTDRVEIRLQDYRRLGGEQFDAISSIGMSEHVGQQNLDRYFTILRGALRPEGRLLNHAISSVGGSKLGRPSFIGRYVFPDGELIDVGETCWRWSGPASRCATSSRCASTTPRHCAAWVSNLEANWDDAVRARRSSRAPGSGGSTWPARRSAFTDGKIAVHQVLGVVPTEGGRSGMPSTRRAFEA